MNRTLIHRPKLRFAIPRIAIHLIFASFICFPGISVVTSCADEVATVTEEKPEASETDAKNWTPLNGKWEVSQFGGDGEIEIKDDSIKMELGDPITGLHWTGDVLRENFEIELEAKRVDGFDFFCGLTFPVGKTHVTLVLGGWGGGVVGISSIDGHDASENDTTMFRNFDNGKWYKVRARVDEYQIQCWIDDKITVEQVREGHEFDIRYEMDLTVPVGLAAFQCDVEYRNMRMRKLTDEEIAAAKKLVAEESKTTPERESGQTGADQK